MPERIQRRRTRGWKMPGNTVSVCRPGPWGNMFIVSPKVRPGARSGAGYICVPTVADAAECYREYLKERPDFVERIGAELRGKNLACFCLVGEPRHGDVLLEVANGKGR